MRRTSAVTTGGGGTIRDGSGPRAEAAGRSRLRPQPPDAVVVAVAGCVAAVAAAGGLAIVVVGWAVVGAAGAGEVAAGAAASAFVSPWGVAVFVPVAAFVVVFGSDVVAVRVLRAGAGVVGPG